jgi:ribonuclease HI
MADTYIIHTDGGSRGNPGLAAAGFVIESEDGSITKKYGEFLGSNKTNNEAEYKAVILALKKLKHLIGKEKASNADVKIYTDSELLERQMNGKFKITSKDIGNFFLEVWNLKLDFKSVSFSHIYREKNKIADSLVNQILDKEENTLV